MANQAMTVSCASETVSFAAIYTKYPPNLHIFMAGVN